MVSRRACCNEENVRREIIKLEESGKKNIEIE